MTGSFTDTTDRNILNWTLAGGINPGTVYLALLTTAPTATDPTMASLSEMSATGYARQSVTWGLATTPISGQPSQAQNTATITYGPFTAPTGSGVATTNAALLVGAPTLAAPTGVTTTPVGTAGSTSYSYEVTAVSPFGETTVSTAGSTSTGNATLSGTNYNNITWNAVNYAFGGYNVYGRTSSSYLKIANVPYGTTSYQDTGTVTPSGSPPGSNTTGGSAASGNSCYVLMTWAWNTPASATVNESLIVPVGGLTATQQ